MMYIFFMYLYIFNFKFYSEIASAATVKQQSAAAQANADGTWSDLELQLLVKATTLFPIGTASRWEVIANYINEHGENEGRTKTGKQVINKVKNLKKSGRYLDVISGVQVNYLILEFRSFNYVKFLY